MEKEIEQQIIQHLTFNPNIRIINYKCDYVGIEFTTASCGYSFYNGNLYVSRQEGLAGKKPKHECLLRLRPLIDLYQTDFFETLFVPDGGWCEAYEEWISSFNNDSEIIYTSIKQAPYEIVIWCLENHYDVFGLIEKGYAEELI